MQLFLFFYFFGWYKKHILTNLLLGCSVNIFKYVISSNFNTFLFRVILIVFNCMY